MKQFISSIVRRMIHSPVRRPITGRTALEVRLFYDRRQLHLRRYRASLRASTQRVQAGRREARHNKRLISSSEYGVWGAILVSLATCYSVLILSSN